MNANLNQISTTNQDVINFSQKMSQDEEHGGIEKERIINQDFHEELICPICQRILWEPQACSSCEVHFCKFCIQKWLETSNKNRCPNNCPLKIKRPAPILMSLICKLKIKCINHKLGCDKVFAYDSLIKHQNSCEFELLNCQFCQKKFFQKEIKAHYEKCESFLIECKYCQSQIKRIDYNNHNQLDCITTKISNIELLFNEQFREVGSSLTRMEKRFNDRLTKLEQTVSKISKKEKPSNTGGLIDHSENVINDQNNSSFYEKNNDEDSETNIIPKIHEIDYDLLGIHYNISLQSLVSAGWQIIYNKGYDYKSTNEEILEIKDEYSTDLNEEYTNLICIGAINENEDPDDIILCGIDYIAYALRKTNSLYQAVHGSNDIYWYWVEDKSFGFSPKKGIWLSCADHAEKHCCSARLSWCVHGSCGGSRLGNLSGMTDNNYKKLILVKKLNQQ